MNKDKLPPIELYRKYLNIASIRFNLTIDQCRDKYGLYTIAQWDELFKSDKTEMELAIDWWDTIPTEFNNLLSQKHFNKDGNLLSKEQVWGIYKWEYQQLKEQVKEVDILEENKKLKLELETMYFLNKEGWGKVEKFDEENKRLKEVNKLLVDALVLVKMNVHVMLPPIVKENIETVLKEANLIK